MALARTALLSLLLTGLITPSARATGTCGQSCRDGVAACERTECAGLARVARDACVEGCRGRLGCPGRIGTLAYVVTQCQGRDGRLVGDQELRIRRGDCDPITIVRFDTGDVADPAGLCGILARTGLGVGSGLAGVFQRIGVASDGSGVVFEVTNEFQLIGRTALTAEQTGFFYVRADGTGLRRVGPPSRDPTYRIGASSSGQPIASFNTFLSFSPSGQRVAYTDRGTSPDGRESDQVFTLDLRSGKRLQVTSLPATPAQTSDPTARQLANVFFLDERTIQFATRVLHEEDNPDGDDRLYTIRTDGSRLRRNELLHVPGFGSGDQVSPVLGVDRPTGRIISLPLAIPPENTAPNDAGARVVEVFRAKGRKDLIQLTAFRRVDTAAIGEQGGARYARRGRRVLLQASADPLGRNPFHNCQIFSVNPLGGQLRQLTRFDAGVPSEAGCYFGDAAGCAFYNIIADPVTGSIVFYSNCDPLRTNPDGSAVYCMRADGSGLRQLTHTSGARFGSGGEVEAELPGPIAYSVPIP